MRTNIDIDDELMERAMRATGQTTKKAVVEEALRQAIATARRRQALQELRGMGWECNLEEMRNEWIPDVDWASKDKE